MNRSSVYAFVLFFFLSNAESALGQVLDTTSEEATCKEIGFRPKTVAFGDCVLELLDRKDHSAPRPDSLASNPHERACAGYGFKKGTDTFSTCVMEFDRALAQAKLAQQQYQLQVQQYQQQVAAYEAQQKAIKAERERRKWEAIGRLGAAMANSTSPTFLGALNEGLAAANGMPIARPLAPPPPPQDFTLRFSDGSRANCTYDPTFQDVRCR